VSDERNNDIYHVMSNEIAAAREVPPPSAAGKNAVYLVINNGEEIPPGGGDGGADLRPIEFSDDALGAALSAELGSGWRSMPDGRWWHWNGQAWETERDA
jgi:hypothetical protein